MRVALSLAVACIVLASCDQFASVGVEEAGTGGASLTGGIGGSAAGGAGADANERDAEVIDAEIDAGSCPQVDIAVCDPIKSSVCSGAVNMYCTVEYTAHLTGACVFYAPPTGPDCLNALGTETCDPTFTCFGPKCRKICLCDSDCEAGHRCDEPIPNTGFSVCSE